MDNNKKLRGALPMLQLSLPLILEQFFRILVSSIDTVMLSSYSEKAVAAVGMMSQYVFFINILFNVIAIGTSIVLSQYLGAKKTDDELNFISKASTGMVVVAAVFITVLIAVGTRPLLSRYSLEDEVRTFATEYFFLYGGLGAFFISFSLLQSSVLRAYGYTKEAMVVSIVANVVNVAGNALSLYGLFGLPILGVKGVALSSLASMVVSCILLGIIIRRKKDIKFKVIGGKKTPAKYYRLILSVGVPTASESLSYNVSQIVIMAMISSLGTYAMSSQVYTQTICRFVFMLAVGIGNAVQIKTGYCVGAGQQDYIYKKVFKYGAIGTGCTLGMILLANVIKHPIIGLFTKQPEVHELVSLLLLLSIYLEFGRSLNLVFIGALKGAGDILFPVLYGIFSNWVIMVGGSYLLGLRLGLGVAGFWIGIATDETTRGIVMIFRWKSKKWMKKSLV
ncbi:MAG TPA: MATE family efflux transporter [Treponema sp.]|nr:MATE family efflux transporter [Treponema sp.]